MRRRTRGIPVLVVLLAALVFGISTSSATGDDPTSAPIASDVSAGLQSFAGALTSLSGLNELGQSLPFTGAVPTDANGLDFAHSFADSLQAKLAAHGAPASLTDLESYLNSSVAGTYGGVAVTAASTISPQTSGAPLYTITLNLGMSRSGTTPLALHTTALDVNGGSLATTFSSNLALTFKYDPAQAAGNKFYLDAASNPALTTTASAAANFTTSPFDVNLGITNVHVGGTADVGATISAQLQDPDGNGKITQTEWSTTAPQQEFDVAFSSSHANADLTLSSDIAKTLGGTLAPATIHEADTDLANGLDTPTVDLGDLGGFENMQPQDFLSGLASLAIAMQTLTTAGPAAIDLPFLNRDPAAPSTDTPIEKLGDVVKLNSGLLTFFQNAGLSNPSAPLTLNFTAGNLANLANVQQILTAVGTALGTSIAPAYDPTTKKLTFTMSQSATPAQVQAHVAMNDQLKAIGLTGVSSVGLEATVKPDYNWHVQLGVDLNPAGSSTLNDRVFVVPSGTEFQANAPITAQLALVGQVGFLGVKLESYTGDPNTPVPVDILAPADPAKPMVDIKLKDPGSDELTMTQFFNAFGSKTDTADPFQVIQGSSAGDLINAAVPPFNLKASAGFANDTDIVSGTLHVGWSNILDPTTLSLSAEPDFDQKFLDFAYDPSNPQAMFTQLLQVLGPLTQQISQMVQSDPKLQQKLPLINKSFADLITSFTTLSNTVNDFASNPQGYLQAFESALEKAIGDAFNIPETATTVRQNLVSLSLTPASGGDPAEIGVRIAFGICTSGDGSAPDPDCTATQQLHVPLSISLPDVGGLVSVSGTGGVDITSKAIVKIGFGIKLPSVSIGLPGGDPTVSGSPQLFLSTNPDDTALNIDVNAATSPGTTLSASVGPFTMKLGKVDYVAESGSQCAPGDTVDDNHNGVVNDGCPAVGPPEDPTTGQCTGTTDEDSDGSINDGCPVVQQAIEAKVGAKFHLSHDSGDLTIDPTDLSNLTTWIGELVPTSVNDLEPTAKVTCQQSSEHTPADPGPYDACASIPVYVNPGDDTAAGLITFVAPNVFDTSTWDGHVDDGIMNAILGQPLDWATAIQGLTTVVDNFRKALDASAYGGASLPIIGHSLDGGAKIADKLDDKFVKPLKDAVGTLNGASFSTIQSTLKDTIWNNLGGGTDGAGLVLPYAANAADGTTATEDDIKVTPECGSNEHPCVDGTDPVSTLTNVEVSLAIGGTLADAHFKFDSGFPGLRLSMDNPIDASVKFRYEMTFGLSRSEGFYVRTDSPPAMHSDGKEISVDASVHLPDTGTHGDIAFLRIDATNNQTGGHKDLDLQFAMDVKGGHTDPHDGATKLTYSDLTASDPSNPADFEVTLGGTIDVNLHLVLSANMPASVGDLPGEGALPKLSSDLKIKWSFGVAASFNNGISTHLDGLSVNFDNVQLDLGSFFNDFLGPIVRNIQQFTKPLQPVIDTAEAPIPGLSQLSELAGNGKLTFLDFFEHASGADLTMVHRIIDLINLINNLPKTGSLVDIGHFSLDGGKVEGAAPTGDNADTLIDPGSVHTDTSNALSGAAADNPDFATAQDEGGLSFPAFQNPSQLFGLLVGKDVKLVEYDAGSLSASFGFDITIGPFPAGPVPVSIIIGGSAGIEGHFAIGYSTRGIREAVKNLTDDNPDNDGALQNASLLIDGVFLDDLNSEGVDVPEIRLTAEVHAGAEVDIVIASAGIEVGLQASVDLNLHDGGRPTDPAKVDGLVYIDELASAFNVNPICVFDVDGELDAFVKFFIDVGISPFDVSFEVTLVEVTLLDMKDITGPICDHPDPPHLAQQVGSTLVLKMGPNTPGRNLKEDEKNEKFVVRQLDGGPGGHHFSVTAFGLTQTYPEKDTDPLITHIYANGGDGKDTITMQPGVKATNTGTGPTDISTQSFNVSVDVTLCGGSNDDHIQGGDGNDTIVGDGSDGAASIDSCVTTGENLNGSAPDGNDNLGGGAGNDTIDGNGGGDAIVGEDGNDTINAGSGVDNAQGGAGSDTINGGDDADTLTGGPENDPTKAGSGVTDADVTDHINGGNGADNIDGGPGPDVLNGDAQNDSITGGTGNDTIDGGSENDLITAGKGDDTASGGSGNDVIFGQEGNDTLNGNDGNDNIVGSIGNDTINGGADADWILGDDGTIANDRSSFSPKPNDATDGADTINGGDGSDIVYAEGGGDTVNGDGGTDELHGQNGADVMNGGTEDDVMFGDAGADTMHGNAGNDTMRGGSENDQMFGDENDDTMFGDAGSDTMHGNDGIDHMRGGTENDLMYGDANDDVMNGDAGPDTMYGNDGNDAMHGDAQDDYMEGNGGTDTMTGDAGQDDMIGGSSNAAAADMGDVMYGGDGITPNLPTDHDVMVGDNGTITRPGSVRLDGAWIRNVLVYNLAAGSSSTLYGNDTMWGNDGNDAIYAGNGDDTAYGGSGDDSIEGNAGNDSMFGDSGQDDLIGGTSQDLGGTPDGNDCIEGDTRADGCTGDNPTDLLGGGSQQGGDVMIGDNGSITRTPNAAGTDWVRDDFGFGTDGVVRRTITLYDVGTTTFTPPAGVAGDDTLYGDDARDVQYGQGGNDTIHGGNGDDYAEGNAGSDTMYGEAGNDDLVGGSIDALRLDANDTIDGGPGYDVIAGDNAVLARTLVSGHWVKNTYDDGIQHQPRVLDDIDSPSSATVSGGDTIYGGTENDLIYGQGGSDTIQGNAGDDFIEGNAAGDVINGNENQDDIIGGTVQVGVGDGADTIHGDDASDVIAGDNATITRPLDGAGQWIHDNRSAASPDIVRRAITLYDVATTTSTPAAGSSDGDTITGDAGTDLVYGQGGDDQISGGTQDDVIEGNAGNDTITGDAGSDDIVGGGSSNTGVISDTSIGNGLVDGADTIHGNENGDAVAGDNARIVRIPPYSSPGLWTLDVNSGDPLRKVQLFDLDSVSSHPAASTNAGDSLFGDDGRDVMAGQGGDDTMSGGDGVDYMTGNTGNDTMSGDGGEDDMIGGSSAGDGFLADVLPAVQRPAYSTPRNLSDGNDTMNGNLEDDAMVGDNASIVRPELPANSGTWWRLTNASFDLARRVVTMEKTPESAGAFGNDTMSGGDGHDDMYGQLGDDTMSGNEGEDAMVGDLGLITNNLIGASDNLADPASQQTIAPSAPFFDPGETIFNTGSLYRQVQLYAFDQLLANPGVGNDTMFGGDGHDSMHGGPGADVMDGNAGDDYLFAGDSNLVTFPLTTYSPVGADALWGGPGHDTMFGGHGIDYMDVLPRPSFVDKKGTFPKDPQAWFDAVLTDPVQPDGHAGAYSGSDIMYGGWDQDWMQADISGPGPPPGDRLVDWQGGFNAYYRCDASYGDWGITRQFSPSMQTFLQQLAFGMGAVQTTTAGTSGYDEVAMVFAGDPNNANPVNPDNPGHFTCGVPHS